MQTTNAYAAEYVRALERAIIASMPREPRGNRLVWAQPTSPRRASLALST